MTKVSDHDENGEEKEKWPLPRPKNKDRQDDPSKWGRRWLKSPDDDLKENDQFLLHNKNPMDDNFTRDFYTQVVLRAPLFIIFNYV